MPRRRGDWHRGTARVTPDLDSPRTAMRWVLEAFRARRWETIAVFERHGIPLAEKLAEDLNNLEPENWWDFIERKIFPLMRRGDPAAWG